MSSKKKLVDQNLNDQLRKLYKTIINLPENSNFLENRKLCAQEFSKILSNIKFILKGTENLPHESNSIFIYNHLKKTVYILKAQFRAPNNSNNIFKMFLLTCTNEQK